MKRNCALFKQFNKQLVQKGRRRPSDDTLRSVNGAQ